MADVELLGVTKRYARLATPALERLSFAARHGEFLTIVGPSGCGKTTALRTVAGLENPDAGDVVIGGRDMRSVPPGERNLAMVFSDHSLYPHMTAEQNVAFALRMRGLRGQDLRRRALAALELLEAADLARRTPGELSSGQRQRIALAKAIARAPDVACLLLDEPLSHLDVHTRLAMRSHLKSLHRRLQPTIIHVTHDQEEAMALGDRMLVMAEGRAQQHDEPDEVYRRPANRFVAGYVGAPPMNFFDGVILDRASGKASDEARAVGIHVPIAIAEHYAGRDPSQICLGVRPPDFHSHDVASGGDFMVTASVASMQTLGDRILVIATTADGRKIASLQPRGRQFREGESISWHAAACDVHVFEAGPFGKRIC